MSGLRDGCEPPCRYPHVQRCSRSAYARARQHPNVRQKLRHAPLAITSFAPHSPQSIFDRGYGVVLDSGTTFTYLPSDAFNAMAKAVGDYAEKRGLQRTPGLDPQVGGQGRRAGGVEDGPIWNMWGVDLVGGREGNVCSTYRAWTHRWGG